MLVVARLGRITRRAHTLSQLLEDGVSIRAADMPVADDLKMRSYAAMAQKERELISERTRAALVAARARGTVLGGHRGYRPPMGPDQPGSCGGAPGGSGADGTPAAAGDGGAAAIRRKHDAGLGAGADRTGRAGAAGWGGVDAHNRSKGAEPAAKYVIAQYRPVADSLSTRFLSNPHTNDGSARRQLCWCSPEAG